ncbi:hypothetical protein C8F04DRAFT_1171172 [Mycena alexandri]|uniref:CUE domain-containing protein n=1 Tax=Mycena alexandri TaxID=1745969 RepID=A0AAD6RV94_9AGAR|nr:hypothetical protein C8F04DRAFT_1171172 [Mycena alexandri]
MSDSTPVEELALGKAANADTEATSTSTTDVSVVSGAGAAESSAGDATTPVPTATDPPPTEPTPPAAATEIIPPAATPEPTAAPTPAAPPREREMVADARLGVLRAMFPDFDDSLLQSVLDSVNGNTDLAIDALLGMSDPDYTSDVPQAQAEAPLTQEALDEQLARTLMLEDQRQEHAWRAQQPPQHQQQQRPQQQRRATGDSGGGGGDAMQEFQETFNKFAESGKKTIGSLFSKVKAKIQEFDQPAGNSSSSGDPYGDPYHGNAEAYERAGQSQQSPFPPASRHAQTAQYQPRQTPAQQQVQQERAAMPAYYDPNGGGDDDIVLGGEGGRGYDATPTTPAGAGVAVGSPPLPTTNSGAPALDGGKLGMLPKRPVSLLRTNSPPSTAAGGAPPSSDDEDALEYAESPFGK